MPRSRAVLLFLLAIISGCVYDPKGEYIDPIEPPDTSGTAINLSTTQNPIILSSLTSFVFTVLPAGKPWYAVQVKYDGQVMFQQDGWPGPTVPFVLSPNGHPLNGKLVITVAFPSQSKSIAGQLGAEVVVLTRTWDVIVELPND